MDADENSNVLKILQKCYQGDWEGEAGLNYWQKS